MAPEIMVAAIYKDLKYKDIIYYKMRYSKRGCLKELYISLSYNYYRN